MSAGPSDTGQVRDTLAVARRRPSVTDTSLRRVRHNKKISHPDTSRASLAFLFHQMWEINFPFLNRVEFETHATLGGLFPVFFSWR
jgi:hypothetical protein